MKTVSDLFMPVEGEVIEVNSALGDTPEIVNSDPYGEGWMIKIKLSGSTSGLLSVDDYKSEVGE